MIIHVAPQASLPPPVVIVRADTGVCPYTWVPQAKTLIHEQNYSNYSNFFPIKNNEKKRYYN